jgi:hypothetical protein
VPRQREALDHRGRARVFIVYAPTASEATTRLVERFTDSPDRRSPLTPAELAGAGDGICTRDVHLGNTNRAGSRATIDRELAGRVVRSMFTR